MNHTMIARLGALPRRQLHLLGAALLLGVAAALWSVCLRAPLAQLRQAQTEHARLASLPNDASPVNLRYAALTARVRKLETELGLAGATAGVDQRQLELIGLVNRSALAHGVQVLGAVPTPARLAASFSELSFDISAAGSYQQAADWIAELERAAPNVAVAQLEIAPNAAAESRDLKLRIVAYFPQEAPR